jgi:hypothetical protein
MSCCAMLFLIALTKLIFIVMKRLFLIMIMTLPFAAFSQSTVNPGDFYVTGKMGVGTFTTPLIPVSGRLQLFVDGRGSQPGNIGHLGNGNYGRTNSGDQWTGIGGPIGGAPAGNYGLKHQWGQYSINLTLNDRSGIRDAILFWEGSNNNFVLGRTTGQGNIVPAMTVASSTGDIVFSPENQSIGLTQFLGRINIKDNANGANTDIRPFPGFNVRVGSNIQAFIDNNNTIGTSSIRYNNVFSANGVTTTSDIRDKENVSDLNYGLDKLLELRPVTYNWISDTLKELKIGLIAQEIQEVIPEVVHDPMTERNFDESGNLMANNPETRLGMNYSELIPVLIKSIQELNETVIAQGEDIKTLRKKIKKLKDKKESKTDSNEEALSLGNVSASLEIYPNPTDGILQFQYDIEQYKKGTILAITNNRGERIETIAIKSASGSMTKTLKGKSGEQFYLSIIVKGKVILQERVILK